MPVHDTDLTAEAAKTAPLLWPSWCGENAFMVRKAKMRATLPTGGELTDLAERALWRSSHCHVMRGICLSESDLGCYAEAREYTRSPQGVAYEVVWTWGYGAGFASESPNR